jgi:hypothetical protein
VGIADQELPALGAAPNLGGVGGEETLTQGLPGGVSAELFLKKVGDRYEEIVHGVLVLASGGGAEGQGCRCSAAQVAPDVCPYAAPVLW